MRRAGLYFLHRTLLLAGRIQVDSRATRKACHQAPPPRVIYQAAVCLEGEDNSTPLGHVCGRRPLLSKSGGHSSNIVPLFSIRVAGFAL